MRAQLVGQEGDDGSARVAGIEAAQRLRIRVEAPGLAVAAASGVLRVLLLVAKKARTPCHISGKPFQGCSTHIQRLLSRCACCHWRMPAQMLEGDDEEYQQCTRVPAPGGRLGCRAACALAAHMWEWPPQSLLRSAGGLWL